MRDVTIVPRGEHVHVHEGAYVARHGVFVGVAAGKIIVDQTVGVLLIPLGSNDVWVTDTQGRVLGVPDRDPVLTGDPPALE